VADARARGTLSFGQRRLWFLSQFEPESTAYNLPQRFTLHGSLDRQALDRALGEILRRHDILRTRYLDVGGPDSDQGRGEPRAVVDPPAEVRLVGEPVESSEALDAAIAAEVAEPFDLAREVLRLRLFEPRDGSPPTLLVHVHHIAFDGWSVGVLTRELTTLHDALAATPERDAAEILAPLPIGYAEHAARQAVRLHGDRLTESIEPWRRRLAGLEALELPADRPRSGRSERPAAVLRTTVPTTSSHAIRRLARERGQTLFTTLLAAFVATLQTLTGRDDIVLGVPDAGRADGDVDSLIGFFIDMLVVRADLAGARDFDEIVDRVRATLRETRADAAVPFDKLVEELRPEREPGRNPFFQVAFQVIERDLLSSAAPATADDSTTTGLVLEQQPIDQPEAKFDLTVAVLHNGDDLRIEAIYDANRFLSTTVARWLDAFIQLLDQVSTSPSRPLAQLTVTTAADRDVIDSANRRAAVSIEREQPGDRSLIEQFRQRVDEAPDRVALLHRDRSLTRGEILDRAEHLARHLVARGVRPGDFVGLCVDRGPRLIEGMVGILAAGAAYVPLDADYPEDRLRFMIEDADLHVLLTERPRSDTLPKAEGVERLDFDALGPAPDAVLPTVDGDFPAHVIFTSGSSGRPKGTMIQQRGVTRLVVDAAAIGVTADDVLSQVASPSFDACTWEVWSALLQGARLVIVDRDDLLAPDALAATFERHGVTASLITTAYFQQIARQAPAAISRLRLGLFGGERCDPAAIHPAHVASHDGGPNGDGTRLFNVYGPTECTVLATAHEVVELAEDALSIPIGLPIPRTTTHVVDALGREVGVGVPGELWLGGPGVALGYHQRPALTANVFVPDPFDDAPGGRCYRTGDLVRWLADGTLDYLGRIDQQVKLRGFRIEPGEIESTLARHPDVGGTAVIVREDTPGQAMLVAYATPADDAVETPRGETLRAFLTAELPEFMVPAVVLVLDALPITTNGKVDRRALPAPSVDDLAAYRPPESDLEVELAALWSEVLGAERIGLDDDFFTLGGHSLLAVRLASRIREQCAVEMAVRTLFE
ncbi:MAG: amino acid adenylation domain-containing protein, partial [Acidobacteriota bacterium]